jgi:hypothetical protein
MHFIRFFLMKRQRHPKFTRKKPKTRKNFRQTRIVRKQSLKRGI